MWFSVLILTFFCELLVFSQVAAQSRPAYNYQIPARGNDGWVTAHLAEKEIDTTTIFSFFRTMSSEKGHGIHSILLFKNQHLVLEEYYGKYNASETHDIRSATKSITALLVGIALDKGFLQSIDDPINKYLSHYQPFKNPDARKDKITIRHLLTMSAGWECNDWDKKSDGQEDKMYRKKDWIRFVLDLPMENNPGDTSLYCTGGVVVLGEIIHHASGMKADEFSRKYLFQPLGIENYHWSYFGKKDKVDTGGHLYLTPRDMAKIGQLVLNKGEWNGQQLVSSSWINMITDIHTQIGNMKYGFLWWSIPFKIQGEEVTSICATGNGGQYIMIFPTLDLICVFTGKNYNSPKAQLPFHVMNKIMLPAQPEFAAD